MVFIVKKEVKGKKYYYLRKSERDKKTGKVVATTIAYLGKTKKVAEEMKKKYDAKEFKQNKQENKMEEKISELKHKEISIDEMANFCKRKGFVYASGELYGGLAGFWDFGHLGSELKNNLKKEWWKYHVHSREDIVGIDGSIITNPKVWEASGHVASFVDVAVVCKKCKNKFKADKFEMEKGNAVCEKCGASGENLENKGEFNPMFTTQVGPVKEDSILAYLRPETAQLIFADFKLVQENARLKLPFGIAQQGKSFRNEIAPRNFLFRSREFEQMEIEYFIDSDKKLECPFKIPDVEILVYDEKMQKENKEPVKMRLKDALEKKIIMLPWHAYWLGTELNFFKSLGVNMENFRIRQHMKDEKSHYATDTWDLEYKFPFGWKELQGIADRGIYDLSQHEKFSKKDLKIVVEENGEVKKVLPMVVAEPSLGVERAFLVLMFDAYHENEKNETILKLHPKLSPIKVAVFPLVKNDKKIVDLSREVYNLLKQDWNVLYDSSGSVGRRYARNDEVGTPFCVTIDGDSLNKNDVTIRDRNTTKQIRVKVSELKNVLRKLIDGEIEFESAGKKI